MKLIKDVRYGNIPISRIYFNNELIYDRCVRVIVTGHEVVENILTAAPETMFCSNVSARGVINPHSIAILRQELISDSALRAIMELESIVAPHACKVNAATCVDEIVLHGKADSEFADISTIRLYEMNDIIAKANPHANIEYVDGRAVIPPITTVCAAKNVPVALASAVTKVKCNVIGTGKDSRTVYANTHGEIDTNAIVSGKTSDAKPTATNSTINISAVISASDVVQVDAAMHGDVSMDKSKIAADYTDLFASGHETVGVEIHLASDQLTQENVTSHEMIAVELIAAVNDATSHGVEAHGNIDTTQVIPAILWRFPDDTGDYLLITQAYDINDTKLETDGILEVV